MSGIHASLIGAGAGFIFVDNITTNTLLYNLRTRAVSAGWDGVIPILATVNIISSGTAVDICSNSVLTPAFDTGTTAYPDRSSLVINISANSRIVGAGGSGGVISGNLYSASFSNTWTDSRIGPTAGGTALRVNLPTAISNLGTIASGGAGGGAGGVAIVYASGGCDKGGCSPDTVTVDFGGGGGGGMSNPLYSSPGGGTGTFSSNPGVTIINSQDYPESGFNTKLRAQAGASGTSTAAGSGGLGVRFVGTFFGTTMYGGNGGAGGSLGQPGSTGTASNASYSAVRPPPQAGGASGAAVIGNSFITWLDTGTRLGTLS